MKTIKRLLFVLLLCGAFQALAQEDTLSLNGFRFFSKKVMLKNEFGSTDTLLKLYRIENGKPKYLLKHYLYSFSADCNNSFEDKGSILVHLDSITFLTHYSQKTGLDPIPLMSKQVYVVQANGKLILVSNKIQERSGDWVDKE
jgi:hypothetical protein